MKIKKLIETLEKMKAVVGDNAEVPVMSTFGENDYFLPAYGVIANLKDQDGNEYKCALIAEDGGEELTKSGVEHWKWNPTKDRI